MLDPKSKIKVGLLVDSYTVPAWEYYAVERLLASECARIELLIINAGNVHSRNNDRLVPSTSCPAMYRLLDSIDRRIFHREPDPFTPIDIRSCLFDVPSIAAKLTQGCFDESTVSRIRDYNLDILVQFGFNGLNASALTASRYGIWYYRHSGDVSKPDVFPGFWEVIKKYPETEASINATGGYLNLALTLYRSHYFTYPLSPTRNRGYCFWAASAFLSRQVEHLYRLGEQEFMMEIKKYGFPPTPAARGAYAVPSNLTSLAVLGILLTRTIGALIKRSLFQDTWYLLSSVKNQAESDSHEFRTIMPPRDRMWADPMIIRAEDKYFVFIEELFYKENKGHISVIEMKEDGGWKDPVPVLETPHHLSYPFVFYWDGRYYMIPESASTRTIDLYECEQFPHQWRFRMTLMSNVIAVDSTLFYHDDRWWLFTAMAHHLGAHPQVELFLFCATDFQTNHWKPHPRNPIVSDIKNARPAGRIYKNDGKIYRPSQYGAGTYGFGFDLNEVDVLTETDYREHTVESVRPNGNKWLLGTHTYGNEGKLTVIDAFSRRSKLTPGVIAHSQGPKPFSWVTDIS